MFLGTTRASISFSKNVQSEAQTRVLDDVQCEGCYLLSYRGERPIDCRAPGIPTTLLMAMHPSYVRETCLLGPVYSTHYYYGGP